MILGCNNINKSFITDVILDDITFHIEEKEKAALIGVNGSGKTTLLRIIAGEMEADSGTIRKANNCSIGYLPQHVTIESDKTIYEELLSVFDHVIELESQLEDLEREMASSKEDNLTQLAHEYDELLETFENNQGYMYKSLLRGVLAGLGFDEDLYHKPITVLSGGQKTRVALAKLLLQGPNVLLLDEPTNHLDIEAIAWLENFLKSYDGAALIISHDRYFLDTIVSKVVEIEHGKAYSYNGDYSSYAVEKKARRKIQEHHYINQQKKIQEEKESIELLKSFNREKSVRRARSKEKQLAKVDVLDKPMDLPSTMNLQLSPSVQSGLDVLKARDLEKSFGDNRLFTGLDFHIRRGDKIALVGANGIGKTSLFKIIMGKLPPSYGEIRLGSNVFIGYYDQEHEGLNQSATILQELENAFPEAKTGDLRSLLASFLFTGEDVFKEISTLSGGEKGRVALAKIILSKSNFLLLDEPTNHLDIQSKEILEEALQHYEGTVLYISHDRYFINQTANKVFHMTENSITEYLGDYDYFVSKSLDKADRSPSTIASERSDNQDEWLESKKIQTQIRRLENQLEDVEAKINELEDAIEHIDDQLCLEEVYTDPEKSASYVKEKNELEKSLEETYHKWEKISLDLEEFSS